MCDWKFLHYLGVIKGKNPNLTQDEIVDEYIKVRQNMFTPDQVEFDYIVKVRRLLNVKELENVLATSNIKLEDLIKECGMDSNSNFNYVVSRTVNKKTFQPEIIFRIGKEHYCTTVELCCDVKESKENVT